MSGASGWNVSLLLELPSFQLLQTRLDTCLHRFEHRRLVPADAADHVELAVGPELHVGPTSYADEDIAYVHSSPPMWPSAATISRRPLPLQRFRFPRYPLPPLRILHLHRRPPPPPPLPPPW